MKLLLPRLRSKLRQLAKGRPVTPALLPVPKHCTIFHLSHWKAATSWVREVLVDVFGPAVAPRTHFDAAELASRIEPNKVYAGVCYARQAFTALALPFDTRYFVVLRDLRDTLVSAYFSLARSHPESPGILFHRTILSRLDQEAGLRYVLHAWLPQSAFIHRSWLDANEPFVRYEDLIADPVAQFCSIFRDRLHINVERGWVEKLLDRHRFERYSGGRCAGSENADSQYRKGIAGDWRNYFTPALTADFKRLYNDLLVRAGYEQDDTWTQ